MSSYPSCPIVVEKTATTFAHTILPLPGVVVSGTSVRTAHYFTMQQSNIESEIHRRATDTALIRDIKMMLITGEEHKKITTLLREALEWYDAILTHVRRARPILEAAACVLTDDRPPAFQCE